VVEPGKRGLDPIGRMSQGGVTRARSRGIRIAARPALEQTAKRKRRSLARTELADETSSSRPLRGVILQHVGPAGLSGANGGHD
jgi:hypothetical protein